MLYFITKTGLDIFDLCRVYGLAMLLDSASPEEVSPIIHDAGNLLRTEYGAGFFLLIRRKIGQQRLIELRIF